MGLNGRVWLVCFVFFLNRGCAWGSDRGNGDSRVREVLLFLLLSSLLLRSLLMLLEVDEMDRCNCDE